jgi:hypothetical protein
LGVPAQKMQRRLADPLQSFARDRQKDFRLHPSRKISKSEILNFVFEMYDALRIEV